MNTVVTTRQGDVRGALVGGILTFRGIPYAAPPFGAGRLRPPRPHRAWAGVRDALAVGARTPQPPIPPDIAKYVPDPSPPGEECLNLNVWTPSPGPAGLPTMVFLPGGMFEFGSGASYDGSRFARDGVVCVTINYRVGAEGFLFLGDGTANLGLLDQVAALAWVRDNVAAFGGDPANVTVFGESAGAMSVGALLAVPRADGLFRRAVAQSGAAHTVTTAETALRAGRRFAEILGVGADRAAIAAAPLERFLAAQADLKGEILADPDPGRWGMEVVTTTMPWQPVVDGDVIPAYPIDRIAAGSAARFDVMVGSNTDDWKLFVGVWGDIDRITDEMLAGPVETYGHLSLAAYGLDARAALAAYRSLHPGASAGEVLAAAQTDWWCRIPAIRLAEAHAGSPSGTYMYEFAWRSPAFGGRLGACHALELPFVFDTLDKGADQMAGPLLGPDPPQRLAGVMHAAWVAFATRGDPGWPRYEPARRATMRFGATSDVVFNPHGAERALWEPVRYREARRREAAPA